MDGRWEHKDGQEACLCPSPILLALTHSPNGRFLELTMTLAPECKWLKHARFLLGHVACHLCDLSLEGLLHALRS